MTAAHLTEFRAAVDAQQQRASLYSNGYATEERNYWTDAYGDGEKRLTLKDWMRSVSRDSEANQRQAYEEALKAESRRLPEMVTLGRQELESAQDITDPLERALALVELLEMVEALAAVAGRVRADALAQMRKSGMTLQRIGEVTGMSKQRVGQILASV